MSYDVIIKNILIYLASIRGSLKTLRKGSSFCGSVVTNPTSIHLDVDSPKPLALLSGLRIQHCRELWFRSHMLLESGIAVAMTGSCSSDLSPSLGTSICHGFGPKKKKKIKKGRKEKREGSREKISNLIAKYLVNNWF